MVRHPNRAHSRPTTTLRELANLLYIAEPTCSRPFSFHDFRIVFHDRAAGAHRACAPMLGITRVTQEQVEALLQPSESQEDSRAVLRNVSRVQKPSKKDPAVCTLMDMGFSPGDILECAIRHPHESRERRHTTSDSSRRRERSPDASRSRRYPHDRYRDRAPSPPIPPPREM